jgi:hypothetical protein
MVPQDKKQHPDQKKKDSEKSSSKVLSNNNTLGGERGSGIPNNNEDNKANLRPIKWKECPATDRAMVFLTGLVIICTIALIGYTKCQVEVSREAVNVSRKIADSSYALSKSIADSQERFVKIDTRAYLNFKLTGVKVQPKDTIRVNYEVINSGKTPARYVYQFNTVFLCPKNRIDSDNTTTRTNVIDSVAAWIKKDIQENDKVGIICGSNIILQYGIKSEWTISPEEQQSENVYVLGLIKYYDVFNEIHYTWFCLNLLFNGNYIAYDKYNEAD